MSRGRGCGGGPARRPRLASTTVQGNTRWTGSSPHARSVRPGSSRRPRGRAPPRRTPRAPGWGGQPQDAVDADREGGPLRGAVGVRGRPRRSSRGSASSTFSAIVQRRSRSCPARTGCSCASRLMARATGRVARVRRNSSRTRPRARACRGAPRKTVWVPRVRAWRCSRGEQERRNVQPIRARVVRPLPRRAAEKSAFVINGAPELGHSLVPEPAASGRTLTQSGSILDRAPSRRSTLCSDLAGAGPVRQRQP